MTYNVQFIDVSYRMIYIKDNFYLSSKFTKIEFSGSYTTPVIS